MFHVICELENASHLINDVPFEDYKRVKGDGVEWMSVITVDPVAAHIAGMFKGIPGYQIIDAKPAPAPVPKVAETDAEKRGRGRPSNAELAARQASASPPAAPAVVPEPPSAEPIVDPAAANYQDIETPASLAIEPVAEVETPPAE